MDCELVPGCYIECKFIGYLETEDDAGIDPKILMCPSRKVDPTYSQINNIDDLPNMTLEKIKYFFSHYKDLENKKVTVGDFKNREEAIEIYKRSLINK
jgi:inorganic pyrophosphatase